MSECTLRQAAQQRVGCLGLVAEGGQGAIRGLQAAPARLPNSAARLRESVRESVRAIPVLSRYGGRWLRPKRLEHRTWILGPGTFGTKSQ